jgi:hypothetical protein
VATDERVEVVGQDLVVGGHEPRHILGQAEVGERDPPWEDDVDDH